jgi:phosphoesterase RecJ-like protein
LNLRKKTNKKAEVNPNIQAIRSLLRKAETITIVAHKRPDGDAVGSALALTLMLERGRRSVTPILVDDIPPRFRFLPGAERIRTVAPQDCDLVICVDCADLERTGLDSASFKRQPSINIDHHPTNTFFADINLVYSDAAATTEIIYQLAKMLDLSISEPVRINLMTGLLTDTIGFSTTTVNPNSLRMAADLIEQGTCMTSLYDRVLRQHSFDEARYWGCGLVRMQRDDEIVWTRLTLKDRIQTGYSIADDANLIDFLTAIDSAKVAIILVEQPAGKIKVSWRARPGLDVSQLALQFGGGGHKPAAGAMIEGNLDAVEANILAVTREHIRKATEKGK